MIAKKEDKTFEDKKNSNACEYDPSILSYSELFFHIDITNCKPLDH